MTNKIHPLFPTVFTNVRLMDMKNGKNCWNLKQNIILIHAHLQTNMLKGYHLTGEARGKSVMHKDEDLSSFFHYYSR
ncbi:MAG: hypothetical protein CM15mV4_0250 [Caudoviricetes sp.]|nr:MAG: hypothetical protein CM15mV4_0250 [Caudoviricetes sp.]